VGEGVVDGGVVGVFAEVFGQCLVVEAVGGAVRFGGFEDVGACVVT
jgi:hypothetical protein